MKHTFKRKGIACLGFATAFLLMGSLGLAIHAEEEQPTDEVQITATKTLEGRDMVEGEFEFELYEADAQGNPTGSAIQTKTNDSQGNITFDSIKYDTAGEYNYVIKEKQGTDANITYDSSSQSVKVTVTQESNKPAPKASGQDVEYSHNGTEHSKRVIEDGATSEVYCINRNLASASSVDGTKTRQLVTAGDTSSLQSELNHNTENNSDWKPTADEIYNPMVIALYNGYGIDHSGLQAKYGLNNEDFYEVTQHVIFWLTLNGKPGAPSYAGQTMKSLELRARVSDYSASGQAYDELLDMARNQTGPKPEEGSYNLYVYQGHPVGGTYAQSLVRLEVLGSGSDVPPVTTKAVLEGNPTFKNVYSLVEAPKENNENKTKELSETVTEEKTGKKNETAEKTEEAKTVAQAVQKAGVAQAVQKAGTVQTGMATGMISMMSMAVIGLAGAVCFKKENR